MNAKGMPSHARAQDHMEQHDDDDATCHYRCSHWVMGTLGSCERHVVATPSFRLGMRDESDHSMMDVLCCAVTSVGQCRVCVWLCDAR
jgi:hypothetical protein